MPSDYKVELLRERYALRSLLEFVRTLTPTLGAEGILKSVLRTLRGKSLISDSFAYLRDWDPLTLRPSEPERFSLISKSGLKDVHLNEHMSSADIASWVMSKTKLTLIPIESADDSGISALIGLGESRNPATDRSAEKPFLESLSALTGIALLNARLFESERQRARMASELELAREIQQTLLPQFFPEFDSLEFAAESTSSELVGGDYYDVIALDNDRVLVAIADVVGKGVSAALTMSNLVAALRALAPLNARGDLSLVEIVSELNRLIFESTSAERFITGIFGIINSKNRQTEFVICGHPKPIRISKSGAFGLEATGIPLGIIPTFPYDSAETVFGANDWLVFYTDGLSEATASDGIPIGPEGVGSIFSSVYDPTCLPDTLPLDKTSMLEIGDDFTVLVIRFKEK